jgi:hypothetical protein
MNLFLFVVSLGSLERIDLLLILLLNFGMSRKITGAGLPLHGRIGIAAAKLSGGIFHSTLAAFALLNDCHAGTTVVPATRFGHEGAFCSRLRRCTNHDTHLQFWYDIFSPPGEIEANNNREFRPVKRFYFFSCINFT